MNEWNQRCFENLPGNAHHINRTIKGVFEEVLSKGGYKHEKEIFPVSLKLRTELLKFLSDHRIEALKLKVGMKFIFTKNIFDFVAFPTLEEFCRHDKTNVTFINIANGSQGKIIEIYPSGVIIQTSMLKYFFPLYSHRIYFETKTIGEQCFSKFMKVEFYPFNLSYALTFHKSQGLTLEEACISVRKLIDPASAYVAISRVRTLQGVYIIDFGMPQKDIDETLQDFYKHPHKYRGQKKHVIL